jgi:hypothetical protein
MQSQTSKTSMVSRLEPDIPCKEKEAMKELDGKPFGRVDDVDENVADFIDEDYVAQEKSLVRKLDMTLMPTIFVLYLLNYLDRNNIAYVNIPLLTVVYILLIATI